MRYMKKAVIRIKNWPFEKGEKAKLRWIGEPFKINNKWMFYAYFQGDKHTKRVMLDWATVHFLSVNKYYTDGDINNGKVPEEQKIININLTGAKVEYKEKDWGIWGTGFNDSTKSKTFNFHKNGKLYTVPIIEIIRAVLAPDRFMLNRILEMNTYENYFTYSIEYNKMDIHFTSEYEKILLKDEKINHIAWILTNPAAFKMFNTIGKNIWNLGELKFDFLLDRFSIMARVIEKENYTMIVEIVSVKNKKINVNEIDIYHPGLQKTQASNEAKIRKYIGNSKSKDKELDPNADGSTNESEEIDTNLITHEYTWLPDIKRIKTRKVLKRTREDENTKTYMIENGQARTTADSGGEELLKGLEFTSVANIQEKGELQEFIEILRMLEKRDNIKSVQIIIGELPEGLRGKKFSRLSDGITRRKYAIGKVTMVNGRECSLIEIERENKALSMLILKAYGHVKWNLIYSSLLIELVEESGKWSNEVIKKVQEEGIVVYRSKHIKNNIYEKADHIFEKLA